MTSNKKQCAGLAKISRPRPNKTYPRARLFRHLDRSCRKPVVWIAGSPGAGKTTLVASYLEDRNRAAIWYQLDRGDGDVATFFHYLAVAASANRRAEPLLRFTTEHRIELEVFTRRFFEQLYDGLGESFVVVFDNYHEVPADSALHDVFRWGLEQMPTSGCAIVISRSDPPNSLGRLESSRAVAHMGDNDLRLRLEEARGIARLWRRWESGLKLVPSLHRQTEGWAAGLVLMLEHGAPGGAATKDAVAGSRDNRFRYFGGEILDHLDDVTRDVLQKTAVLPVITPELARALNGNAAAGRIIAAMHRRNYFTERLTDAEPVYRYHALFREFLLDALQAAFTANEINILRRTAIDLLEQAGRLEEAAGLCHESGQWDRLAALCRRLAPDLLAQGRTDTLRAWLLALPEAIRNTDPSLQLRLAQAELSRDPGRAYTLFEQAYAAFERTAEAPDLLEAWCGVVDAVMYSWDDFARLDPWIARLERLESAGGARMELLRARAASAMFGALMFRRPQHPRIQQWAERSLVLARRCGDPSLLVRTVENQSHYYIWTGDLPLAGALLEESNELLANESVPVIVALGNTLLNAMYRWHTAEFERAIELVDEGLALGCRHGVRLLDTRLAAQAVYASIGLNDPAGADRYRAVMKRVLASGQRLDISHYYHIRGWLALLRGDTETACHAAVLATGLAEETGTPFPVAVAGLNLARALHARGEHERALERLATSRRIARDMGSTIVQCQSALFAAAFALAADDNEQCAEALCEGLGIARGRRYWNTPCWDPALMARLCAFALENDIEPGFVRELIRRRALDPPEDFPWTPRWPWPVRIRALGGFSVEVNGTPLAFERKARRRPLDLLRVLVALGGRGVAEHRLADILWPDAEGDTALQSLSTTVHRARRLLERGDAIVRQEGRLSLNKQCCWVDAMAFEDGLAVPSAGVSRQRSLERSLALYDGALLDGQPDNFWSISARERLEGLFVLGVKELAAELESQGLHEAAIDWYQRAVERAPMSEPLYRGLIRCAMRQGETATAVKAYRRCETLLQTALGIAPSPKTRELLANHVSGSRP